MNRLTLCQYAVQEGENSGADEIEAIWMRKVNTAVKAQLGQVNEASTIINEGMRIRVIVGKAAASIFTYRLDKPSVSQAVKRVLKAASASKKDPHWKSLPQPGGYPHMELWDSALEEVNAETMAEPVTEMLDMVPSDVAVYLAAHEIELTHRACASSSGIQHEDKGALEGMFLAAVGILADGVTAEFQEFQISRKYNPDPSSVVTPVMENIEKFRAPEKAASGKSQVVFSPLSLEALLFYTLFRAVSGESVVRGKSKLAGKEGEKIASSCLTLHDNGMEPRGVGAREMDDEGVPSQDTPIIEEGILKGFIWDNYWGKRAGRPSTGNAHYDWREDRMLLQQSTMTINPGTYDSTEILDISDGYYVDYIQGAHGSNPESGDFSVVCAPAFRIRKGEMTGGVTGIMLSDNIFSLLTKIDAVGSDSKICEYSILPHVRFSDANVIAK
ncbi:MAG: TldD/PmbA family protein [Theionarchaea archaeon]|nr:TldD/PmbA family protein [Theionarchaea archaeon]MBU7038961.1 TldD/PmbA family protein [Theionarchaea archaeon]